MRRFFFILVLAASLAIVAALPPVNVDAQSSQFSSFSIQASSSFLTLGQSTTLSTTEFEQSGTPTGDVEYYISSSARVCTLTDNVIGVVGINTSTLSWTPTATGAFPVCALYIPGPADPYSADTAGPHLVTVTSLWTSFTVTSSPTSVPQGGYAQLTATLAGTDGNFNGTIEFFTTNATGANACQTPATVIYANGVISNGTPTYSSYYWNPNALGTFQVCASYVPNPTLIDPYPANTTGPIQVTFIAAGNNQFTRFDLGASPNPMGDQLNSTLTSNIDGNYGVPPGQINFYTSTSATSCNPYTSFSTTSPITSLGDGLGDGVSTASYYASVPGTFPICAAYIPATYDPYGAATAGPYLLSVNQPTILTVIVPPAAALGQTLPFLFTLTTPPGQTGPTGGITLYDPNQVCQGNYGCPLGSVQVNGGGTYGPIYAALSGSTYTAVYSGDANYGPEVVYGTILVENGLSTIRPAAVTAGSGNTSFTLTGPGITGNAQVELFLEDGSNAYITPDSFNLSAVPPQLQFTIPSADLGTIGELYADLVIPNVNGALVVSGGPVQVQVYALFADTAGVSTTPTAIPYGTTLSANFNANITRGSATIDAAVPAGQVALSLNGTNGNTFSASLGSATLSQVTTPGTYLSPFTEAMDANGTGKLISADLNGDGFVDVVGLPTYYYGYGASTPYLQVMLSTGFDGFQAEQMVYTGCPAQDFAVGDIDGDGIPDLVVVCTSSNSPYGAITTLDALYMPGNGDGTFQSPVQFGGGSYIGTPTNVVLGQFNNDGHLDIAVIDGFHGIFQIISPFGDQQYGPQQNFSNLIPYYGQVVAAAAADFNQDGLTDLVLEEYNYNNDEVGGLTVFISYGGGGFYQESQQSFDAGTYTLQSMTVTDVDGDGYPDVAIADPGGLNDDTGSIFVFQNDTYGDLNQTLNMPINGAGAIVGVPFPTIGKPAAGASVAPGWNLAYSYIGNNNDFWIGELQLQAGNWSVVNSFDTSQLPNYCDCEYTPPNFIVTGDMNGDGYLDLAINGITYTYVQDERFTNYNLQPWYFSNDAQASVTGVTLPSVPLPGTYTLSVSYPGSPLYQPGNASNPITITQGMPTGSLTVNPTGTSYAYGTNLTFNASVIGVANGVAPTEYVTFYDNGTQFDLEYLGSDGGTIGTTTSSISSLTPGSHKVCISYSGDGDYSAEFHIACINVQISSLSLSLTSTAPFDGEAYNVTAGTVVNLLTQGAGGTIPYGQTITLTGLPTVAPVTPTTNGIGIASYQYGLFPPGTYTIQASINLPGAPAPITSNPITLNVSNTPVNVTLTPSANPVTYPNAISLTANATTGGLGVPTGFISFQNAGSPFASDPLSNVEGSSGLTYSGIVDSNPELTDRSIVTGDFNGDGNQDLAVLQGNSGGTLLISLGNGDGTFQAAKTFTVDSTAVAMGVADFNKDGNDDLVIANSDGTVSVYLSSVNPNGNVFSLALSQSVPLTGAIGVATGDFNGDGYMDFAAISSTQVTAFYNNGAANFPSEGSWSTTSDTFALTGITVADFNQDHFADIAVSDNYGLDVAVFLYNPDGGFNAPSIYGVGASASAIASGDISGDGYPDLAVVSNTDSTVAVLINSGTSSPGTFGAQNSYGVAYQPTAIAMNDFNQDGYADIAIVGVGAGVGTGTTILLGSSTGNMYGETYLPTTGNVTTTGISIATADFNQDGNPDLAVGNNGTSIFLDTGAQATASNVALPAGTAPLTGVFTAGETIFAEGTSQTLNEVVNQATPTLNWPNPAAIAYGTPLGTNQLTATAVIPGTSTPLPGTFTYTPPAGTILPAGSQTLSVTFVPTDSTDYMSSSTTAQITVIQAATTISWAAPASIPYGTTLSATQLNATALIAGTNIPIAGTLTYTPPIGTLLTAGIHQLTVSFVPTDSVDYADTTGTVSITVSQTAPVITWPNPAAITYGTVLSGTQLNARSSVPGVFTYTPATGVTLTAGTHQLSVTFVPTDSVDYSEVTTTATIVVNKATTTVSWTNPAAISYGTPLTATQLNATASVPGTFTYTPASGSILTAGTQALSVNFTPTDSTDYSPSTGNASITVNKAVPTITWVAPAAITYGTALGGSQLDATASTAGTLTYSPTAGTVLGAGPQTLNVSFAPSDTVDYTTATTSVPIQVNQATPVITWSNPAAINYGTPLSGTQLDATATPSGGTFTYSPPAGTTLPQGAQTLRVTYVPPDSTDYATAAASVTIQVNPPTLTLNLVSSTTSTTAGNVVTFQVQANGTSTPAGQIVTLTGLPTAATVQLTLNGDGFASYSYGLFPPGTYTVQASLAGGAAASNTVSLNVSLAAATVALASSANPIAYPTPMNLTATVGSNGLGVPTGTISFQDNGIQVGSGTLATVNGSSGLVSVGTVDSITGQTVISVVTGDFNKDGNQDIAALETGSGVATLLISLGNGDGTFKAPVSYASTSSGVDPTSVAMASADFNGDGYTDLVIAASDGNVSVLLAAGDAAGDLALSQQLQVYGAVAVATGDFNKDGNQDFAVISTNTLAAFYGTGSTPSNFPSEGSYYETFETSNFTGITVADFNHDGYDDIAVSDNAGPDTAVFLYNAGGSGFTGPQTYPVAGSADAIASGDINGDGYPDVAVVSKVNSTVDVLINNGSGQPGTFPEGTIYGVSSQSTVIAMNDFNKDGYADIAVAGTGSGQGGGTVILLGSSTGAMTGETSLPTAYGESIASADFNNDGNPDLAVGLNGVTEFLDSAAQAVASNIVLNAGTQPLTAIYTPSTSSIFAASTSQAISEVVNSVGSTITWPTPASITYGTALSSTQLDATAPVPGTFTYSPPLGMVLTVGTQQLSVSFVPTDSVDYASATASVSVSVTPAPTTVTWTNPTGIAYGTALTNTQLDATASVPGTFNYSPALGTVLAAGTHQLTVSFVPNDTLDYLGSTATASITVSQTSSTVTWPPPASIAYGTPLTAAQFDATSSVPGSFTYTPPLGTILTAGTHTLTAVFTPSDSTDYAPTTTTVSITINRANPSLAWTTPAAITYGTALGAAQLDAIPSTPGALTYNPAAGTVLGAGPQTLNVSFTPTDTTDYNSVTASVPILVNQATPVITWTNPVAIGYGVQLSATQLNATASPIGGVFAYTPPVGTVLPVGTQTLSVTYTPADTIDYTTGSASVTILVNPGLTFTSVSPSSGAFQSPTTTGTPVTITLNGTGFSPNAVVQLAWASGPTTLTSSYIGPDQLTATIPAIFFQQTQPGAITVTNPATGQTSASIPFTITLPNIQLVFSGPGSESEAQQPSLNLQFLDGYPVPLQATLSLTVQPATAGGAVDPAVQFSTGGTTFSFTEPANSTTAPSIQLQTGTLAGTITVSLKLEANNQDVTPAGLQPVIIIVPASAPVLTSLSVTRSGNTLTVTVQGYSSTRDMTSALFNFTPAAGQTLLDAQLTVDVGTDFSTWYGQQSSIQYGSAFTYTQAFDLSTDASSVGGVSVTLTNSVGASNVETAN
ncbi:MAG: FG-GAP-like repeat-containing protein [Terracidiphilus sp.]